LKIERGKGRLSIFWLLLLCALFITISQEEDQVSVMKKSYAILVVYDSLRNKKSFQVKDMEKELGCSRRTCLRYTKDIKDYLSIYHPELTLFYDRKKQSFLLKQKTKQD